jgi:DNA-directed RNA polymerase subunit RPC12/RpoP
MYQVNCPKCSKKSLFNYKENVMIQQTIWINNIQHIYYVCTNCGHLYVDEAFRKEVEEYERCHVR